eukprot:Gb_27841 [translate_table: standard]
MEMGLRVNLYGARGLVGSYGEALWGIFMPNSGATVKPSKRSSCPTMAVSNPNLSSLTLKPVMSHPCCIGLGLVITRPKAITLKALTSLLTYKTFLEKRLKAVNIFKDFKYATLLEEGWDHEWERLFDTAKEPYITTVTLAGGEYRRILTMELPLPSMDQPKSSSGLILVLQVKKICLHGVILEKLIIAAKTNNSVHGCGPMEMGLRVNLYGARGLVGSYGEALWGIFMPNSGATVKPSKRSSCPTMAVSNPNLSSLTLKPVMSHPCCIGLGLVITRPKAITLKALTSLLTYKTFLEKRLKAVNIFKDFKYATLLEEGWDHEWERLFDTAKEPYITTVTLAGGEYRRILTMELPLPSMDQPKSSSGLLRKYVSMESF